MSSSENLIHTDTELALFSSLSSDTNPLHMSDSYVRKSQFGRRVVFGVLGVIKALAKIEFPPNTTLESATLDFQEPQFLRQSYQISIEWPQPLKALVPIFFDGKTLLSKYIFRFRGKSKFSLSLLHKLPNRRREPLIRTSSDLGDNSSNSLEYNLNFAELVAFDEPLR